METAAATGRIVSVEEKYGGYIDISISQAYIAEKAKPGQFVLIKPGQGFHPLLGRPFDIADADSKHGIFRVVIKVKGEGTALLRDITPETQVPLLGPLGTSIDFSGFESIGLLVRGVGAAAVTFLARRASEAGVEVVTFLSASEPGRLVCLDLLMKYSSRVFTTTEDATLLVEQYLSESKLQAFYTCGSRRFARYTEKLDSEGISRGFVFLEGYMACGVGNCHGCAVKKRNQEGYFLVCKDGPVFPVSEVVLE